MNYFFSATAREDVKGTPSPYEKLIKPWNSQDYPNVIVLSVSATPWNLQTVNTKINRKREVIQDSKSGEISEFKEADDIHDRYKRSKFSLHEIPWMGSHESDLKQGIKKCRLVVGTPCK